MKKIMLAFVPVFFLFALLMAESYACEVGCTPGYWKQSQHYDSWPDELYTDTELQTIFPCAEEMAKMGITPSYTLLDALTMKGGGVNALLRHAVAAYLNGSTWPCFDGNGIDKDVTEIAGWFCKALNNELYGYDKDTAPYTIERTKDWLENHNEQDCKLN